jgi:hypothetical protein
MRIGPVEIAPRVAMLTAAALLVIVLGVIAWALATHLGSPMEDDLQSRLTRYYTEPVMQGGNFAGDWRDLPEDEQAWFPHLGINPERQIQREFLNVLLPPRDGVPHFREEIVALIHADNARKTSGNVVQQTLDDR